MTERKASLRRSYIECPPMDERKWSKVPSIPADVFLADMEDSVPPSLKEQAREKVLSLIKDPGFFGGREFICRPNNLSSPWGHDDLEALAQANAPFILYPKVRTGEEMRSVKRIFDRHGTSPEIQVIIETPQAIVNLGEIAACPGVTGLMFGPGDLSMETGIALLDGQKFFEEGYLYGRSKTVMVAKAYGLETTEGLFLTDLKDLESFRRAVQLSKMLGFTGNMCFYPPHVPIINEIRTPTDAELLWANRVIEAYEEARERGLAAVTIDDKWITIHQYTDAQRKAKAGARLSG